MSRSLYLLLAVLVAATTAELTDQCLYCMCYVSSNGCVMPDPICSHTSHCGPWAFSYGYWMDGGELGESFLGCAADWECSETTVRRYMDRYVTDASATCEQYAKIHMGGPWGAASASAQRYWESVHDCLISLPTTTTAA